MSARRRRGPGEGTIRERVDGRWEGRLTTGRGADGRQQTRSVFGKTRAEAVAKLDTLKGTITAGLPAPSERLTVGAYLTGWLPAVKPRLRLSTFRRYQQIVRGQVEPALGRVRLARLRVADVESMMATVKADGLSARTAAHCRAVLRAALSDAERDGLVGRNVAKLARAPHVAPPRPTVLRPDEARRMVASLADPGLRRLATVAMGTGLRQGELLGLRWEDIDVERRAVHVRSVLVPLGGGYGLAEPKSASSRRVVPVGEHVLEALSQERQAQREAKLAPGRRWREAIPDLCFTTATGAPRNGNALTHSFQDALAAAGLPRLTWHDLRAVHGALLLQSGTDISVVSRQLGHGSVGVTARHYGGVADSLGREAADRLEALIGRPS
jgi:integrase